MEFPLLPDLSEDTLERITLQAIQRASGSQIHFKPCWEGHFDIYFVNYIIAEYVDREWIKKMRTEGRMRFIKNHVWHQYRHLAMRMYKRIMFDYLITGKHNGIN